MKWMSLILQKMSFHRNSYTEKKNEKNTLNGDFYFVKGLVCLVNIEGAFR